MAANDTIEFILKLRDLLSGGMATAARNSITSIDSITAATKKLQAAQEQAARHAAYESKVQGNSIAGMVRQIQVLTEKRNKLPLDSKDIDKANVAILRLQKRVNELQGRGISSISKGAAIPAGSIAGLEEELRAITTKARTLVNPTELAAANQRIIHLRESLQRMQQLGTKPIIQDRAITRPIGRIELLERALRRMEYRRRIAVDTTDIQKANTGIKHLQKELNQLQGGGGGRGMGLMGSIVGGNLVYGGLQTLVRGVEHTIIGSIRESMDYSMLQRTYQGLTGSKSIGNAMAERLRQDAQNTIMGTSVFRNAQTMLGFGINHKEVVKDLEQIGNIALGDKERMQALTLAYSQTQSAGKLMGQDLLQYINAGFNPLSVMVEKWQQFGFKQKVTGMQLRQMMQEGKISSAQVAKAFELATSKGGKFYNMLNNIGDTEAGKLMKAQGQWKNDLISLGYKMQPVVSGVLDLAHGILKTMDLTSSIPSKLMGEKASINSLVKSITQLNQGNMIRGKMIDELVTKYPDLFAGIDKEKVKNEQLLSILNKVNAAYDKRIRQASIKDLITQLGNEAQGNINAAVLSQNFRDKSVGPNDKNMFKSIMKLWAESNSPTSLSNNAQLLMQRKAVAESALTYQGYADMLKEAQGVLFNSKKQQELWGKDLPTNRIKLLREVNKAKRLIRTYMMHPGSAVPNFDFSTIQKLLGEATDNPAGSSDAALQNVNANIAGGGHKVVTINMDAMVKGTVFHVQDTKEAVRDVDQQTAQSLLRTLDSALGNSKGD